jgi:hypothetical protein
MRTIARRLVRLLADHWVAVSAILGWSSALYSAASTNRQVAPRPGDYSGESSDGSLSSRIRRRRAVSLPPIAGTLSVALASPNSGMLA